MTHVTPVAIHVAVAEDVARTHGYDQVVIYARVPSCPGVPNGLEWITTYGESARDKQAAAQIGAAIRHGVVEPLERLRGLLAEAEVLMPRIGTKRKELLARIAIELAPQELEFKEHP